MDNINNKATNFTRSLSLKKLQTFLMPPQTQFNKFLIKMGCISLYQRTSICFKDRNKECYLVRQTLSSAKPHRKTVVSVCLRPVSPWGPHLHLYGQLVKPTVTSGAPQSNNDLQPSCQNITQKTTFPSIIQSKGFQYK